MLNNRKSRSMPCHETL